MAKRSSLTYTVAKKRAVNVVDDDRDDTFNSAFIDPLPESNILLTPSKFLCRPTRKKSDSTAESKFRYDIRSSKVRLI